MLIHRSVLRLVDAASRDVTRFVLNGVQVRRKGKRIEAVATDGKILARTLHVEPEDELPTGMGVEDGEEVDGQTIPTSFMVKLRKFLEKHPLRPILNYVRLRVDGGKVDAEVVDDDLDVSRLSGKVLDGKFPSTDEILADNPQNELMRLKVDPYRLVDAVKLMLELAAENGLHKPKKGETHIPTIDLVIPKPDDDGNVRTPLRLTYSDLGNARVDVMLMPIVQGKV